MISTENTRSQASREPARSDFDVERIRRDFPILQSEVNGKPLVYLDNAASSQKPRSVVEAVNRFYAQDNANIHRGVHALSVRATQAFEQTRSKVRRLIGAARVEEIIFVRGATEGINLVANTFGRMQVGTGDEIVLSSLEHHSNIVPWQVLCQQTGARLRVAPINDEAELLVDEYEKLLGSRTKLVAITHVSNAVGTINPVKRIVELAHDRGIPVLLDGAQATPHVAIDVVDLDCDFYVFSSHKMFGPTGVGVLYGKTKWLEKMPPYEYGGEMIKLVTFEETTYNDLPYKFEAGTPNIAGVIGLGAAIDYINEIGYDNITAHEHDLLEYGIRSLSAIPEIRMIGTAKDKAAVLSFVIEGIHPHDVGTILDGEGVAVRTGHHCAQPLMQRFHVPATVRASLAMYNTKAEIDTLVAALGKAIEVFK